MRDLLVGPYLLGAPLGGGGMGDVHAAVHPRWGHALAVKIARGAVAGRGQALQDEIRAIATLDHPHVVRIYDQGVVSGAEAAASGGLLAEGSPWLAMERAAGVLAPPNDWATLRRALVELLDGLAAAHAVGVLHLDVKPSNVLVRADGSHALADFGIVVLRGALGHDPGAVTWGSPTYMAPERFDGRLERLVEATDLYAVGCVAFQLAQRAPPFACPTWARAAEAHRSDPPPPLAPRVPVPTGFSDWVHTLLAKRPGDRFETAADARDALLDLGEPRHHAPAPPELVVGPTLTATTLGDVVDLAELLAERPPRRVAPLPDRWTSPARPRRLESVGLGLLGLLAVPFVGRPAARDTLWRALRAVEAGGGPRVARLTGPRGVGRTRLGEEFVRHATEHGAVGLRVGADLDEALRQAIGVPSGVPSVRVREAVALRLGLGVTAPRVVAIAAAVADPSLVVDGLVALASGLAARRPVVLWVDDAHDPERLALVAGAVASGPGRLLVVAATADARAVDLPAHDVVALEPLDVATARRLLADWVGLGAELVADLAERCEGDVGLALSMVRDGVAAGRLAQGPTGLEATDPAPLPFPDEAVAAWRPHLPAPEHPLRPALERAAALGPRVDRDQLGRALGDPSEVPAAEAWLTSRGLVVPTSTGWRWPSPTLRAALLEGAGPRRAAHHVACAGSYVGDDAETTWARGAHLLEAGVVRQALPHLVNAASDVIAAGKMADAARRLSKVEDAMRAEGIQETEVWWGILWRTLSMLGPTHQGYAKTRDYNLRTVLQGRAFPDDPHWTDARRNAAGGLVWLANVQLLPHEARRWLAEERSLRPHDGNTNAYFLDRLGWHLLTVGDPQGAMQAFQAAAGVARDQANAHMIAVSETDVGVAMRHAGHPDAVAVLEVKGRAMLDAGIVSARADLAAHLGDAERQRGRYDRAAQHYEEALRAAAEGEARADPGFRVSYALLLDVVGDHARAVAELDTARRLLRDEGPSWEALIALHRAAAALPLRDDDALASAADAARGLLATGLVDPDVRASATRLERAARERGHPAAEALSALVAAQGPAPG